MGLETNLNTANQRIILNNLTVSEFPSSNILIALFTSPLQSCRATMHSSWFFPVTSISCWNYKNMVRETPKMALDILRFFSIKTEIMQSFHMKMVSSTLGTFTYFVCGHPTSFHQYWHSQTTNQPSFKMSNNRLLISSIHLYIPTSSEYSGSVIVYSNLVHSQHS